MKKVGPKLLIGKGHDSLQVFHLSSYQAAHLCLYVGEACKRICMVFFQSNRKKKSLCEPAVGGLALALPLAAESGPALRGLVFALASGADVVWCVLTGINRATLIFFSGHSLTLL